MLLDVKIDKNYLPFTSHTLSTLGPMYWKPGLRPLNSVTRIFRINPRLVSILAMSYNRLILAAEIQIIIIIAKKSKNI